MSGKLAAHQINFCPWFPWFYKMHKAEVFVLMIHCQFEKNGFQNRAMVRDRWLTMPVVGSSHETIREKFYSNGYKMTDVNVPLILGFAKMLGIDTNKIHYDFPTEKKGTERIIEICKRFDCDQYLTNPDATEKYLDEKAMNDAGIEVLGCNVPPQYRKSMFEMLEENGIEGTVKVLNKEFACKR